MKYLLTLILLSILLTPLVGCQEPTTSISSGSFNVSGNTGLATGQALGIDFEVAGATGVQSKAMLKAGKPEHTSGQTQITLADDVVIQLEVLKGGSTISFQLNGTDFGELKEGDKVVIDKDRNVMVNGSHRQET